MIAIRSNREIELISRAGSIVYETHQYLRKYIKPGITTKKLETLALEFIERKGAVSSVKGYQGFPGGICISINEEVVHGIPGSRKLMEGDIVTFDIVVCYKGYHGDSAWTYPVGNINHDKAYLLEHTEEALYRGLSVIKAGIHVGDISNAIEEYARAYKLGVVKELIGHGIGTHMHQEPDVPNYGKKGSGPVLKSGMVIAVEPMLNLGTPKVYILDDDWTIITADNKPSAHFEHTVVVTDDGYRILTKG